MKTTPLVLLISAIVALAMGHSYVTLPRSRIPGYNCRIGGPAEFPVDCPGPCEAKKSYKNPNIQQTSRGAALQVDWPRNNHGGGFIRLAWAKHEDSDDFQAFNKGVQQVTCHETGFDGNPANLSPNRGCASDDPNNINGGDSGSSAGGIRACRLRTTIPTHLSDGLWTMQWTWYGAGGGYLGDYYSCVDYNVAGGAALTAQAAPVFKGGDVTYPTENVCKFWNTDRPHYCWKEPCTDNYNATFLFPNGRQQKAQAYLVPLATPTSTPTSEAPPPTSAPVPQTTAEVVPVPEIKVSVTVSLALAPRLVDTTVFVYEVTRTLGVPVAAIPGIVVDIDQSTATTTIIHFTLLNSLRADGTRVDPIDAAYRLKDMTQQSDSALKSTAFLSTMQVMSVEQQEEASSSFVGSQTFIIIIAAVGGAALLGVIAAVLIVVIKKKRNAQFF